MLTPKQKTKALESLINAQNILNNPDTDYNLQCSLGTVINDVYDMETTDV